MSDSSTSRLIVAPPAAVFRAFMDPTALEVWQAPGDMTGRIHDFDGRVGGGYRMSLFYPESTTGEPGKTTEREDRFTARFVEITPPSRLVQVITFESDDPAFAGEMTMIVTLTGWNGGTEVTVAFENLPPGIRPEDNDDGTRQSLENLARLV